MVKRNVDARLTRLSEEVGLLNSALAEITAENQRLVSQNDMLVNELSRCEQRVRSAELELSRLRRENGELTAKIDSCGETLPKSHPARHKPDCMYHVDQYPWECTCGVY